jgi:hypothetical protein
MDPLQYPLSSLLFHTMRGIQLSKSHLYFSYRAIQLLMTARGRYTKLYAKGNYTLHFPKFMCALLWKIIKLIHIDKHEVKPHNSALVATCHTITSLSVCGFLCARNSFI